jgi:arginase family enzyme
MTKKDYLSFFLQTIDSNLISNNWMTENNYFHTENNSISDLNFSNYNLFVVGVNLENTELKGSFNKIRKELYSYSIIQNLKICDLGDIQSNKKKAEVIAAYKTFHSELLKYNKPILILSNSNEIAFEHYTVYHKEKKHINLATLDKQLNIFKNSNSKEYGYLGKIFSKKNYISDLKAIATQEYYIQEEEKKTINQFFYTELRLGKIKTKIDRIEPLLRDAHIINFNLNTLQNFYIPELSDSSPNGLDPREACIAGNYCGSSENLNSLAIYPYCSESDKHSNTAKLVSQIIWYFFKSISEKIIEKPIEKDLNFTKYVSNYNISDITISFYKSNLTNRWWIELKKQKAQNYIFPCHPEEYHLAINNEIPDEWVIYFNKISKIAKKK